MTLSQPALGLVRSAATESKECLRPVWRGQEAYCDKRPYLPLPMDADHSTSNTPAAPIPTPTHIVTHSRLAPRRLPSINACPVGRCPLTP